MEDPISFDIWGVAASDLSTEATDALARIRPDLSRMQLLKNLVLSKSKGAPILLASNLAWPLVLGLKQELLALFGDVQIFQTGYGPQVQNLLLRCESHNLLHAGVHGCPVCGHFALGT